MSCQDEQFNMNLQTNSEVIGNIAQVKMCKEPVLEGLEFDGDTVLCRVCGDKASGFHYGVHACEGCKGFFRRSIQQKIQYRPCLKNQQCNIMRVNRNRCQYCRLKKCIAVGMSRDAVRFGRVPKKEKAKIMEQMQKVNNQSQSNILNSILELEVDIAHKIIEAHLSTSDFTRVKFKQFMERSWQNPEFVNCPAHMACPLNPNPSVSEGNKRWEEFSECFTPAIRNVVNFAKCIPGFQVLSQEDQVTLLKAGTFEVLLVHLACLFDSQSNTMLFTNGKLYKRVTNSAGFLLDSMFDFAERLNSLNLTEDEVGLFSAIVIIASDRPGLRSIEQVEKIQSRITQALQAIMAHNHPEDPAIFAKLLMKIPDLRTLNTLHSEKLLGLSVPAASRPQNDKLKTSSENQPPPAYFQGGMLPPGFPPIYSSQMIPGHPADGDPSFHARPPDLPTLPLPLDPPGHPGGMLLPPYGAFPRFSTAILNLPNTDPEYEMAGRKHSHSRTASHHTTDPGRGHHEGKDYTKDLAYSVANQKAQPVTSSFELSRVISNISNNIVKPGHVNGETPAPTIWSPAAMHLNSQDKSVSESDRQPPNVITEPLYPAENQRKRSSLENLAEADSKMARMWEDKAPSGKCPFTGSDLSRQGGFPFLHHSLSPFTTDKHHRSVSESEAMQQQHPTRHEGHPHSRMKSLSESEALTSVQGHGHGQGHGHSVNGLERLAGRAGQDHPVLKTALNTPPLSLRRDMERTTEGLTPRDLALNKEAVSEDGRKSCDSRKSVESRKSDDSQSIDILETHSDGGSKCSSPASNTSEPYLLHKKLKMKRRGSNEAGSDRSSPEGSMEGFTRREEVEGLENKMAELSRPSWEPPLLITPPGDNRENNTPGTPPRLSPMPDDQKLPESRLNVNGVSSLPVTSGFNLSAAVTSHPAYLPHHQFTTLHPAALLYQYNTYAMQHQLAHIQHMQLAQLQMSHQKQKRPEMRNDISIAGEDGVIMKDSNQNSITTKTSSPLNLTTKCVTNSFSAERLISVKDEPM